MLAEFDHQAFTVEQPVEPLVDSEAMAPKTSKPLSGAAAKAVERKRQREEDAEDEAPLAPAPKKVVKGKAVKAQAAAKPAEVDAEEDGEDEAEETVDREEPDIPDEQISAALKKAAREAGTKGRANSRDSMARALERHRTLEVEKEEEAEKQARAEQRLKEILKPHCSVSGCAAETDEQEPPPPPAKKSKAPKLRITLDSEDEKLDVENLAEC